jgi:hypothetical protein
MLAQPTAALGLRVRPQLTADAPAKQTLIIRPLKFGVATSGWCTSHMPQGGRLAARLGALDFWPAVQPTCETESCRGLDRVPVEGPRVLRRSCPVACRAPFSVGGEHVAKVAGQVGAVTSPGDRVYVRRAPHSGLSDTTCWRHLRTQPGVEGVRLAPEPRRRWSVHGLVAVEPRLE